MARRVLVTRPAPEAESLADALRERGIEAVIAPMLEIRPTGLDLGDADGYRAAIATSRNGVDGLATATPRRALPLFAVGEATASRARALGFAPVTAAPGTGHALVDLVIEHCRPDDGPILWASGDEVRVDVAAELGVRGFAVDRAVVYRSVAAARLPDAANHALADGSADGVLFFSPRTAERFASLVTDAGLARQTAGMVAYCLSPAVAEAAGVLPWSAVRTARRPTREDLLAALDESTARPSDRLGPD